jgi:hypothetical protein
LDRHGNALLARPELNFLFDTVMTWHSKAASCIPTTRSGLKKKWKRRGRKLIRIRSKHGVGQILKGKDDYPLPMTKDHGENTWNIL